MNQLCVISFIFFPLITSLANSGLTFSKLALAWQPTNINLHVLLYQKIPVIFSYFWDNSFMSSVSVIVLFLFTVSVII